jgi:hypothetical protein
MHPAAALHRQEFRATIMQDFLAIPALLEELRRTPSPEVTPELEQAPPPEQLALF